MLVGVEESSLERQWVLEREMPIAYEGTLWIWPDTGTEYVHWADACRMRGIFGL